MDAKQSRGSDARSTIFIVALMLGVNFCISGFAGAEIRYTVTDLGALDNPSSSASKINDNGDVIGYLGTSEGYFHSFFYSHGTMIDIGTLGTQNNIAYNLNNLGQIVGVTGSEKQSPPIGFAFEYSAGSMSTLAPLGTQKLSQAIAISDSGQIVGQRQVVGTPNVHAFLYENGVMTNLGAPGGFSSGALDINKNSQIAGTLSLDPLTWHAFLYENGHMTDLGSLGGNSDGWAMNDLGDVVGPADFTGGFKHAFFYSNGTMTDLASISGYANAEAVDINNSRQIVGDAWNDIQGQHRAFLYSDGSMTNLNDLIDPASGWTLSNAEGINNLGQIVGGGINPDGQTRAYLLTPIPEPDWLLIGAFGVSLARMRPRRPAATRQLCRQ